MNNIYVLDAELITNSIDSYEQLNTCFIPSSHSDNKFITRSNDFFINYFGTRYAKKIDSSVQHLVYAVENLLKRNQYQCIDPNELGICLGNNYAGWGYVEEQLHGLYQGNYEAINPYVATAWFPAAGQGECTIRNKFFAHSKTFSCDQLSSAIALEYGIDLLQTRKLKYVLVGGHESLLSPLITKSLETENIIGPEYSASEAASILLLTDSVNAKNFSKAVIKYLDRSNNLASCLKNVQNHLNTCHIDYCILPPCNLADTTKAAFRNSEEKLIKLFFNNIQIGMPTHQFGEISGASFTTQLTVALWMLEHKNDLSNPIKNINDANILVIGKDYYSDYYFCLVISSKNNNNNL